VRSTRLFAVAFAAIALAILGWVVVTRTAPASAAATGGPPARLYAPYFETWTAGSITSAARQSGARYFTLAFLQTPRKGSCTPAWDGDAGQPVSGGRYLSDIASLRALGGDVIPSFGGFSADHSGTELADSCADVGQIAAALESVVTTYNVTRLDFDVESSSLSNPAGIDRRNKALASVEAWAAANGRTVQVQYTLPAEPGGLEPDGLAVLRNAVANGTRVDVVNIMTFDYYDGVTTDMGAAAVHAAQGLHSQLASVYPGRSAAQLWAMEGNTILPGIDDYPKKTEVTSLADAKELLDFAGTNGIGTLSIWAIQRDNGGCPGSRDKNDCSGIVQNTWDFSHLLQAYTG